MSLPTRRKYQCRMSDAPQVYHVTSTGKRRDISKSGHEKPRVDDNHWYISCVDHNTLERLRTLKNERGIHFAVDGYRVQNVSLIIQHTQTGQQGVLIRYQTIGIPYLLQPYMMVYILEWVAIPRRFRILIVRNCYKLRHFGGKTFRRKEDKKKLKHFIPIYMMTYKSTWSKLCPPFQKKKVTEDISYNFVRFHKKNLICFCGIENGLALGETRYRLLLQGDFLSKCPQEAILIQ